MSYISVNLFTDIQFLVTVLFPPPSVKFSDMLQIKDLELYSQAGKPHRTALNRIHPALIVLLIVFLSKEYFIIIVWLHLC